MKPKTTTIALALAASLVATSVQAMTVREFLETAANIPRNPTALLRADTRRLMSEVRGAVATIKTERDQALAAGRAPGFCPAAGERASISPNALLARFNAIPVSRRDISVTQAMREWMAERYPCPA